MRVTLIMIIQNKTYHNNAPKRRFNDRVTLRVFDSTDRLREPIEQRAQHREQFYSLDWDVRTRNITSSKSAGATYSRILVTVVYICIPNEN